MNIIRDFSLGRKGKAISCLLASVFLSLFLCAAVIASEKETDGGEQRDQSTITIGSGERYKTTVERYVEGDLFAQDQHQASLF